MRSRWSVTLLSGLVAGGATLGQANAIEVTPIADANVLAAALLNPQGGIDPASVTSSLSGHFVIDGKDKTNESAPTILTSSGTFTNQSNTYGLGAGIVLSTGDVASYSDGPNQFQSLTTNFASKTKSTPNVPSDPLNVNPGEMGVPATPEQDALLDPLDDNDPSEPEDFVHYDVTQLDIRFNLDPGFDAVYVNVVFGSEEFPEFVTSRFVDAFGVYINGENRALVTSDSSTGQRLPININHAAMLPSVGTELDGILGSGEFGQPLVHTFAAATGTRDNLVTMILGDTEDGQWDATVFLAELTGYRRGDLDGDGMLTVADLEPIRLATTNLSAFRQAYPEVHPIVADMNLDGVLDHLDLAALEAVIPEPASILILMGGGLLACGRTRRLTRRA